MQQAQRRTRIGALALGAVTVGLVAGFIVGMSSQGPAIAGSQTRAAPGGIPHGYAQVDPRNPAKGDPMAGIPSSFHVLATGS